MKPEEVIEELKRSGTLSASTIEEVEENRELRHGLVHYFTQHKDRDFALAFLKKLADIRRDPQGVMTGDSLMLACYILGKHGHVEDCMRIWETKTIDFDTYCYVDIQLVVFAGVEKTIEYLKSLESEDAKEALEYVMECLEGGDFENIEAYHNNVPWYI